MCCLVCLSRLHWLFPPTAKRLKTETEKNTRTYGMRPDDRCSVSEMCYLLIVAWHCTPEAVLSWWLSVVWCSFMEQELAGSEAERRQSSAQARALRLAWGLEASPFSTRRTYIVSGAQLEPRITGTQTKVHFCVCIIISIPSMRLTRWSVRLVRTS